MEQEEDILTRDVLVEKYPIFVQINYNKNLSNWWYSNTDEIVNINERYPVRKCENQKELEKFFRDGVSTEYDENNNAIKIEIKPEEIYIVIKGFLLHKGEDAYAGEHAIFKRHCK